MKFYFFILVFSLLLLSNCRQGYTVSDNKDTIAGITKPNQKVHQLNKATLINTNKIDSFTSALNYGFKIKVAKSYDMGDFKTYRYLELWHNNLKLFTDTTNEYEFNEKSYPILTRLKADIFEIFIEFNDRPNKNKLIFLRIENDKIVKHEQLPTFDGKPER